MTGMKDLNPVQNRVPALQYLDSVESGSVADRAGLQPGDFILAVSLFIWPLPVNGELTKTFISAYLKLDQWRRSGQGLSRDRGRLHPAFW